MAPLFAEMEFNMSNEVIRAASTAAFVLGICAASTVFAADPVTDAMQEAYAPYRLALFKTNSNSQAESQQAMIQVQQSWGNLVTRFGARPPAPYDRDAAFAASLGEVSKVYAKAAGEVASNQLGAAHETLERARDIMADIRHRNHVIVYSDHMNAYHAEMESVLNQGSKVLSQSNGMQQLAAMAGALKYLAAKLASEAPAAYAKNGEFVSLVKGVDQSVNDLLAALFAQDAAAVKAAIEKLKMPYSRLFLKFG